MKQPLKNKTVLVTRSENQAAELIAKLKILGARTVALPLIQTKAIHTQKLAERLKKQSYNWIIFTSPNAVKFFFEKIPPQKLHSKIAAVGTKTKEYLEQIGLKVDFVPTQFTAQQMAIEIPLNPNETVFIPRSNLAKNDMVELLENRGFKVETLAIYENSSISYTKKDLAKIFEQKIDYITFASGSTVKSFIELGVAINHSKVICIGPSTAKIATQNNMEVAKIANPHTMEGLITAIINS